jgi:hypothetical protein
LQNTTKINENPAIFRNFPKKKLTIKGKPQTIPQSQAPRKNLMTNLAPNKKIKLYRSMLLLSKKKKIIHKPEKLHTLLFYY